MHADIAISVYTCCMSEEMQIDGKSYISSKRASELSGYAQDYIGQLARKSLIDARRIGGLWYIAMDSLETYKKKADEFKPQPPARIDTTEPGTLVFFDGKEYLSAAHASEQTGYTQDYVGQLARAGTISSQQVGNRWYVERGSIFAHKAEKDSLLGAVQSESVGLVKKPVSIANQPKVIGAEASSPLLTYFSDSGDLTPVIEEQTPDTLEITENKPISDNRDMDTQPQFSHSIPIRRSQIARLSSKARQPVRTPSERRQVAADRSSFPYLLASAATIIIVLSIGYASLLKQNSVYATNIRQNLSSNVLAANAEGSFSAIGAMIEPFLTHELTYQRQSSQ
jgi:hypothetical protein